MKKLITIFFIVLLGAVACTKEMREFENPSLENKGLVAITMSLKVPLELSATTRATNRDEDPKIESIRVAVFGTSGYPQAYALAEPVNRVETGEVVSYTTDGAKYADTNDNIYYFRVLLPVYEGEAHVHIIANGDTSIPFADQDEESIMFNMVTTDNVGGYWARVILEDGILTQMSEDGIMQTDGEGNFIPSTETAALFKDLVLVRNFAEITLEVEEDAGLSDVHWALVNDPVSGSLAPVKGKDFVDEYKDYVFDTMTGKMVLCETETNAQGKLVPVRDADGNIETLYDTYAGYMVSTALNSTIPSGDAITRSGDLPLFSYERLDPNMTNPTYIMVKALFGDDTAYSYYRLDLMDENVGGYFPLYRNYKYQIKIHKVGNRGASDPEEAANRNSGGNVSMSAETKTLTDVSDGTSRLIVEFVEKTYTTGGQKSFWVYYIPDVTDVDANGNMVIDNTKIKVSVKDMGTALLNGTITKDTDRSEDTGVGALYFYNFNLKDQSESVDLSSVIQVMASNELENDDKSTLYRDLTVTVMKKMDMDLSLDPKKVDAVTGETTILHIGLSDTLHRSMFPLEFYIEDTNRTLNPTGYNSAVHNNNTKIAVPVKTGTCIYDETNTNSYCFIRTVNWDEYEPMYEAWKIAKAAGATDEELAGIIDFTTEFKTIKANSKTTVYVDNEYFNMGSVNMFNDAIDVSVSSNEVAYSATSVTITIQTEEASTSWTASATEGATLSKTEGTGEDTITMTFDENQSFGNDNTYIVTVTSGGKDYPVTVVQKARTFDVTASSTRVAYDVTSVEVNIVAEDGLSWVASVDNGAGLVLTRAAGETSISSSGSHTLTVNFDTNTSGNIKTYRVTVVPNGETSQAKYVEIQQGITTQSPYTFRANSFTISNYTGSLSSSDSYITVRVTEATRGGNNANNRYLEMGRTVNRVPSDGTITITPNSGMVISQIKVTYSNATYAGYDTGATVNTGTYTINTTTGVGTWTGESATAVTINNSHRSAGGFGNTYIYPRISSIEVEYY